MNLETKENLCDAGYFITLPVFSIVVNFSYAQLMMIGSTFVYFTTMLVSRISIARAKTHKAWVEAENLNLEPRVIRAESERQELWRRIEEQERRIEIKNRTIGELSATNRDLSFALLEKKGVILGRKREA